MVFRLSETSNRFVQKGPIPFATVAGRSWRGDGKRKGRRGDEPGTVLLGRSATSSNSVRTELGPAAETRSSDVTPFRGDIGPGAFVVDTERVDRLGLPARVARC